MADAVPPGGTVGILGGGQLGRMLAIAAAQLGLRAHVYAPEDAPPAADVARFTRGDWQDGAALAAFARAVDVVTYEFENVPASVVDAVEPFAPVRPGRRALAAAQDRIDEKTFLNGIGVETAPFAPVMNAESLAVALARIGAPAILKTRRLGYDGKGQARIMRAEDAPAALAAMAGAPAVLEGFVPFAREISVIAARGADGAVAAFDPGENVHEGGILRRTTVPAHSAPAVRQAAREIAGRILAALDYVGVIGVEFFETAEGRLLVNEIAPRVHNTGHWTIEATATDQFRQHIKAICLWPLGDPSRHADAVMENLIGDEAGAWARLSAEPGAALHLYGKAEPRPGRKMGHVTRLSRA
ncbi:MAG: 5-(carboxyamino)imidazole ribonucleotide synthase [Pikeienuella sp.]|uniref:5-(carboxyamino)imidazole ribonucleotide synthase n=1 Tax=Pikeienuella sp. TaxID=2831957 RepID=UPI003919D983